MRPSRSIALAAASLTAAGLVGLSHPAVATSAGFGRGVPEFVNSAAPADLDKGPLKNVEVAGEPSIGVNWKTGAALYQSWGSTYKITFDTGKRIPKISWTDVSSPFSPVNLDPILATNPATGTTIAGGDTLACSAMSITRDDGGTWLPTTPCPVAYDHPTVGVGPAAAGLPTVNGEVAYYCQQTGLDVCSRSIDGGQTWSPGVVDPARTCQSLHGHIKFGPDGTAYVPSTHCVDGKGNPSVGAFLTRDNGLTWSGYGIPGAPTPADGFDPGVAIDPTNRIYESWARIGDYHSVITWSDDRGRTWAPQVDLAKTVSPALTASTFQAVVTGDGGRAAVAYLATSDPLRGKDPFLTDFVGHWYLYVSFTYDGGATWQTVKATPHPVQIGLISAGGRNDQRNLHDFMDAAVTKDGRVVVAYADGCLPGCTTAAQSQAQHATIAYQSSGVGLRSARTRR